MPFSPNPNANERDSFVLMLNEGGPISRARLQEYARMCDRDVDAWLVDAIVWFMHECDRQQDAMREAYIGRPAVRDEENTRERAPEWKLKLADRLYTLAERLSDGGEK